MSQEHEHVEGDQVEASRPVFKSNAEMLKHMHDQWSDDRVYVDLLRTPVEVRRYQSSEYDIDIVSPQRRDVTITFTSPGEYPVEAPSLFAYLWRRVSRLREVRWASSSIASPPGSILMTLSRVFFGPRAHEEVFSQIVADMRDEYFDALQRGARVEAWVTRVRWTWAWTKAAGAKLPLDWLRSLIGIAKKLLGGA